MLPHNAPVGFLVHLSVCNCMLVLSGLSAPSVVCRNETFETTQQHQHRRHYVQHTEVSPYFPSSCEWYVCRVLMRLTATHLGGDHLVRHVPRTCVRRSGAVRLRRESFFVLHVVADINGPEGGWLECFTYHKDYTNNNEQNKTRGWG